MKSNVMVPLKDEIVAQLPWLFSDCGFRIIRDEYSNSFGNSAVWLSSPAFHLSFARDRGDIFVEVASPSEGADPRAWWFPIEDVCQILAGNRPQVSPEVPAIGTLIRENFNAIVRCLGPEYLKSKRQLQRLDNARKERALSAGKT